MRSYRSLSAEVGSLSAEIYREIRRCLRLRGGVVVEGVKWIWKTATELGELLGRDEKTIRRHLSGLVKLGWLKREQLQKKWGMRAYHYTLGDNAPLKPSSVQKPVQNGQNVQLKADKMPASINSNPRSINSPPTQNSPRPAAVTARTEKAGPVLVAVPQDWPELASQQELRLQLENLRNTIPLLNNRPRGQGFALG